MAIVLLVVGLIWAVLGVLNLVGMFATLGAGQEGLASVGLVFNVVAFVLPGLGVAGLGAMLRQRAEQHADVERRVARERRERVRDIERNPEQRVKRELGVNEPAVSVERETVRMQPWTQPKRHKPNFGARPRD